MEEFETKIKINKNGMMHDIFNGFLMDEMDDIDPKDIIIVVDFKTDRVKNEQQLIDAYSEQLSIYADACSKIFSKPIVEKIIYSFHLGKSIKL